MALRTLKLSLMKQDRSALGVTLLHRKLGSRRRSRLQELSRDGHVLTIELATAKQQTSDSEN